MPPRDLTPWLLAMLLCCCAALGCNAYSGEPEQQNFARLFARDYCQIALRCCAPQEVATLLGLPRAPEDQADCLELAGSGLGVGLPEELARPEPPGEGEPRFDERLAADCLERFRARGCWMAEGDDGPTAFLEEDPVCAQLLGRLPEGSPCQGDGACASGVCLEEIEACGPPPDTGPEPTRRWCPLALDTALGAGSTGAPPRLEAHVSDVCHHTTEPCNARTSTSC